MGRPAGRWNMGVTHGVHVRAVLAGPCAYLISSAGGPVAGDEDIRERLNAAYLGAINPS